mmetsp:Transcript_20704/g.50839  ORF Transcript_20704/g.50839 Transcript_20704/m.50839 type:complete len:1283 (-) Transcript_20704:46-3894(-)
MAISPEDLKHCQNVIKALRKEKNNYLFLEPFDLSVVPGYTVCCPKVMDLNTLNRNLEAGVYADRGAFAKDCYLIYENAIAYHSTRETSWIANMAKSMLRVAHRKIDIKTNSLSEKKKSSSAGKTKKLLPTKKNKKTISETATKRDSGGTKLKLKLGTSSEATAKPKVSIKLKTSPQGKQVPATDDPKEEKKEKKAKKPRLTLKLGKPKTSEPADSAPSPQLAKSSSSSGTSKSTIKVVGNSRGKELPKGVTVAKTEAAKKSNKKTSTKRKGSDNATTKTKKIKLSTGGSQGSSRGAGMNLVRRAQCIKVLNGLKRRQQQNVAVFLQPVSDKNIIKDYKSKIQNPMDLGTMQSKLERNEYQTPAGFVLDLRRIFANCLIYNSQVSTFRRVAVDVLATGEQLITVFLAQPEHPTVVYPPLLFCWKLCLSVLDTLYNLTNPQDGAPTALYFLYPVSFYCGGQFPPDYLTKVTKPMDFGTVTKQLLEGQYVSVDQFEADCRLVLDNCTVYYGGREDGVIFTEQASRLLAVLTQQMTALKKYIKSPQGEALRRAAQNTVNTVSLPKPQIHLLLGIIEDMRASNYTDKATKITEPAMAQFEKPVSLSSFPDYLQKVKTPMDLQTVERKVKSAAYDTPEDFEYDMLLIFQNCILYNSSRNVDHFVSLGKYGTKQFKRIFGAKIKIFDDPSSAPPPKESKSPSVTVTGGASKKVNMDMAPAKAAPRISLSSAQLTSAAEKTAQRPKSSKSKTKANQPVPLHIAISQVKEKFPLRRAVKSLQSWEAGCARFFKELMRHTWISAARPKFIFHVPVPVLFPQLREAYVAKIKKPMDLTTVECSLLAGNQYTSPEEFVSDVALVFANAIRFNKDGRDVGDPLSCAYYDASKHLLRYCRWLSLELLAEYVQDSDHVDEVEDGDLPVFSWKLTTGNAKRSREEMEAIVLNEVIEKSLEGDRYTWMEAECEKLMKALRHQSDYKNMRYFIQSDYPPDYTASISKPMDWERCQKTLKKRQYDKFSNVIDDLRLIFSNAKKYNGPRMDQPVSRECYDAATVMATKLEGAINKMMLTVGDRVERERIDHNNAEREIEAAERAEKERIRAQWDSEAGKGGEGASDPSFSVSAQRIRSRSRAVIRRETDFEVPFFDDEDDGQHERSYFEVVKQQKAMFERQRKDLSNMQRSAASAGSSVFLRMMQRDLALKWMDGERKKLGIKNPATGVPRTTGTNAPSGDDKSRLSSSQGPAPESVRSQLESWKSKGIAPLKVKKLKTKKKRRNQVAIGFEEGESDDEVMK